MTSQRTPNTKWQDHMCRALDFVDASIVRATSNFAADGSYGIHKPATAHTRREAHPL